MLVYMGVGYIHRVRDGRMVVSMTVFVLMEKLENMNAQKGKVLLYGCFSCLNVIIKQALILVIWVLFIFC